MTTELQQMRPLRGQDFYQADSSLAELLDEVADPKQRKQIENELHKFSEKISNDWDALAEDAALNYLGPEILQDDRFGRPSEEVWLPPPVRQIRQEVVAAGIFENQSQVEQMAKVYMLGHLGETGVVCPLACTEGLTRVVRKVGSDFLKDTYLPRMLSTETPLAGAQFITEQDMGSDVGALTTEAESIGDGKWRLEGEKWFCSAIDEYFLIAARPKEAPEGTPGVAIFFVPRTIDGKPNNLHIKRLKNKIGTRELPTAEIDLNGALAFNIGPAEDGFKNLMNHVINTSRIMNAASALGVMARAYLEAKNYTTQRSAFGQKIADYPMVQESLAKIRATLAARRAVYFRMLARIDAEPVTDLKSAESYWQRFLINLCKYRTAIGATECTREALLLLGGNGTIESFSILPRLYRDSIVLESWEGSHNTLALQIVRDAGRFPFSEILAEEFRDTTDFIQASWQSTQPLFDSLKDPEWASRHARHFVDRIGALIELNALIRSSLADLAPSYQREIQSSLAPFL